MSLSQAGLLHASFRCRASVHSSVQLKDHQQHSRNKHTHTLLVAQLPTVVRALFPVISAAPQGTVQSDARLLDPSHPLVPLPLNLGSRCPEKVGDHANRQFFLRMRWG